MELFRDLDRETRMQLVFAAYGKAMLFAHSLERRLAALTIAHITDVLPPSPERIVLIKRVSHLTLGQLIKEFSSRYSPSEDLTEELDNMLCFRNELAHRISDVMLTAARDREWEEGLIQDLAEYAKMFSETSALLQPYSNDWFRKHTNNKDAVFAAVLNLYPGATKKV